MLKFEVGDKVIVNARGGEAWVGTKGIVQKIEQGCEGPRSDKRASYKLRGLSDPYFFSYELDKR